MRNVELDRRTSQYMQLNTQQGERITQRPDRHSKRARLLGLVKGPVGEIRNLLHVHQLHVGHKDKKGPKPQVDEKLLVAESLDHSVEISEQDTQGNLAIEAENKEGRVYSFGDVPSQTIGDIIKQSFE